MPAVGSLGPCEIPGQASTARAHSVLGVAGLSEWASEPWLAEGLEGGRAGERAERPLKKQPVALLFNLLELLFLVYLLLCMVVPDFSSRPSPFWVLFTACLGDNWGNEPSAWFLA